MSKLSPYELKLRAIFGSAMEAVNQENTDFASSNDAARSLQSALRRIFHRPTNETVRDCVLNALNISNQPIAQAIARPIIDGTEVAEIIARHRALNSKTLVNNADLPPSFKQLH